MPAHVGRGTFPPSRFNFLLVLAFLPILGRKQEAALPSDHFLGAPPEDGLHSRAPIAILRIRQEDRVIERVLDEIR
jgi:hypothetical protein